MESARLVAPPHTGRRTTSKHSALSPRRCFVPLLESASTVTSQLSPRVLQKQAPMRTKAGARTPHGPLVGRAQAHTHTHLRTRQHTRAHARNLTRTTRRPRPTIRPHGAPGERQGAVPLVCDDPARPRADLRDDSRVGRVVWQRAILAAVGTGHPRVTVFTCVKPAARLRCSAPCGMPRRADRRRGAFRQLEHCHEEQQQVGRSKHCFHSRRRQRRRLVIFSTHGRRSRSTWIVHTPPPGTPWGP